MTISTRVVAPLGLGRKDYSLNAEFSTESLIRSHLERSIWTDELTRFTLPYPLAYFTILTFSDAEGNILLYVPDDIKYIIYDLAVVGDYNSLVAAGIQRRSWPGLVLVDTVGLVFGYGRAEIQLKKGHVCEPGLVYTVVLNQWSEKPTFTVYSKVHGMSDSVVG